MSPLMTVCWRAVWTSTTGDSPVTVTDSARPPTFISAPMVMTPPPDNSTPSRTTVAKPASVKVILYVPGGRSGMRYWPDSSETPVRALVMSAGLDASIVTPGSTAPEVSRTVPARLCAVARLAPALRIATATSNRINSRFMSEPPQPLGHEECPTPGLLRRLRDYGPFDQECQEIVIGRLAADFSAGLQGCKPRTKLISLLLR